jgi:uncharacterized MAPEG superfamily protein
MMSVETWALFGAMVLGLVHLTAASFTFKAQVGNAYSVGPRDEDLRPSGVAGRLDRAQRNFLETFAIFAAAVLLLVALDREGSRLGEVGAVLYLAGRTLFLPLYAIGAPWLRTFSWNAATLGLALVMAAVVWPA